MASLVRYFLSLFLLALLFPSCKKYKLICTGNCANLIFAGSVVNKSFNTPLTGQKVQVYLSQNGYCIICSQTMIASGETNSGGYFSIPVTLDSTVLANKHLYVSVTAPANYTNYAEPSGPGIQPDADNISSQSFYAIDPAAFQNVNFSFYSKALLKINLHRTSAIDPHYPYLDQTYSFDDRMSIWGLDERPGNADTTLTIYTAANIFTKIVSTSLHGNAVQTTQTDSIKCNINTANAINISY